MKTNEGAATTASASLSGGSVTVSLTVPPGISFIQAHSDTFTVTADLQRDLPLFNGEKILTASVEFDGQRGRTFFFTQSGMRVSSEQLFALR